ncbi:MAG: UPF0104 family protein [Candidatus Delongbacteria bacterium]|nr:UPF0104 family protein [Candidatus Delongbacteria bacterium]
MTEILEKQKPPFLSLVISLFISTTIVILILFYLRENDINLEIINNIQPIDFLFIFVTHSIFVLLMSIFNKILINTIDPNVSLLDCIFLQYVNIFFNKLFLKGGGLYRAIYLKRKYYFSYTLFISTFAGAFLIIVSSQLCIGIISMILIYLFFGRINLIIFFIYLIISIIILMIYKLQPKFKKGSNWVVNKINRVTAGWQIIKNKPGTISNLLLISIFTVVIQAVQLLVIYKSMKFDINYLEVLYLSSLSIILVFINITPDGIGIRESLYAFSSDIVNISRPNLILGSLILRTITFIIASIVGIISYSILEYRLFYGDNQ